MKKKMSVLFVLIALITLGFGVAYSKKTSNSLVTGRKLCNQTSWKSLQSCEFAAQADLRLALAECKNILVPEARSACGLLAQQDLFAVAARCGKQFAAHLEVCSALGKEPYDPIINTTDFVDVIDNPYLPLKPGSTFIYEGITEDGNEHEEFQVTHQTKVILGVTCIGVRDISTVDGAKKEDTMDWFAQDRSGNVWYFGELAQQFQNGKIVGTEGSWTAGVDGAKPGIIMKAAPKVGDIYRQEFAPGIAEDMGRVLGLNKSVTVPTGSFRNCLVTKDYSPLEPDAVEQKFYAPGVGQVRAVDVSTGEKLDLIQIITE
jgi:hypothetical protein